MAMRRCGALVALVLGLGGRAEAQSDAATQQCQAQLLAVSDQLNSICCADPSNCQDGFPRACDAACAAVWEPFATPCAAFVSAQFPNLVAFSRRCDSNAGSNPPPPAPPVATGAVSMVDATFVVNAASSTGSAKRTNRYTTNFRADLADALNLNAFAILIDGVTASSVHVIIEGGNSQAILTRLQTQANDPNSALRQAHAAGNTIVSVTARVVSPPPPPPPPAGGGGLGFRTTDQSPIGHMHISVDNSYTAYINGAEAGSGSDWSSPDTHDFSSPCHQPLAIGFHGVDAGGPAAGLVSVEWCGSVVTSQHNWRCTAQQPADGWSTAGFQMDDSWGLASHGGKNGVPPWGHLDGMNVPNQNRWVVPSWIWTDDFQGTDEVWCRYVYDPNGPTETENWGDGNGGYGQGHICADDSFTLYINGAEVVNSNNWQDTKTFSFPSDDQGAALSHTIPCNQDNVYAIKGTNGGGGAGIIGDITHCGREIATIPARWKCSTSCPDGWETNGFDDSAWEIATDFGVNGEGSGLRDQIDSEAHWIWADPEGDGPADGEQACCRYTTSGSHRINCNAARTRYQEDYLQISACHNSGGATAADGSYCHYNNDYAYTHFLQNGASAGYIWHDELCNPDGTDVAVTMSSAHGVVHVTADNGYSLYINEEQIGRGESWVNTDEYTFDAPCDQPTVYAIEGYDLGGIASVIMEATHCGEQVRTDTRWKCQHSREAPRSYCTNACREGQDSATCRNLGNNYLRPGTNWGGEQACKAACDDDPTCNIYMMGCGTTCGHPNQPSCLDEGQHFDCLLLTECEEERSSSCGSYIQYKDPSQHGTGEESTAWLSADFDDSTWASAQDAGDNGVAPWGLRSGISGEAHWIWTHENQDHDAVFCRYVSHHVDINCPASAARYLRDYPDLAQYPALDAFSHYNGVEGGKSEGRIWHSELCNADGTNKGSHCQVIHTDDQYDYQFITQELHDDKAIQFTVKANNDAHIGFFESSDAGGDAGDFSGASHGAQYEIVLSGWGGTQSVIREEAQGTNHAVTDTTGIISPTTFRHFWASAANGIIRLGRGNVLGFNVLLQWQDPDAVLDLHYAAVATGWGSAGDWVVCLPESCAGYHDAMEGTGTDGTDGNFAGITFEGPEYALGREYGDGTGADDFSGAGVVNFVEDPDYDTNTHPEYVTWQLWGCPAGRYDLGFVYSADTPNRPMMVEVNGVTAATPTFSGGQRRASGASGQSAVWAEEFVQVDLIEGQNSITLAATGHSGPDIDMLEVNPINGHGSVSMHGVIHITADNGYVLYINGDRIGAGGAGLPATDGSHDRDGWVRTDTWSFRDSCQTPTTYAIEGVDSEGVAALLAEANHCGFTTTTGTEWKCAVAGCTPGAGHGSFGGCQEVASREFVVIPQAMTWPQARSACRTQFPNGDLASIHSAGQQRQAAAACRPVVEASLPDGGVSDTIPHGCWIGLNDQSQERRILWSDGSPVDYAQWAPGEPNACNAQNECEEGEDFVEMDFRGGRYGDGLWNDSREAGHAQTGGFYPLCESITYAADYEYTYLGCFIDDEGRDLDGLTQDGTTQQGASNGEDGIPPPFFTMGGEGGDGDEIDGDPRAVCAQLCSGFRYFALQFYNQCFCDNANIASLGQADESECNTPCNGHDGSDGTEAIMCGGTWRNSVYEASTNNWEKGGYDDSQWESAQAIGPNGVSPWYARPDISDEAEWIWTPDENAHDHIFCRYVQSNAEVNCPAAQARYWFDYPDVRARNFPAWQHFQDEGKVEGFQWHSELCNTCTGLEQSTVDCVQNADGSTVDAHNSQLYCTSLPCENPSCSQRGCTDKCRGIHIGSEASLGGSARIAGDHAGHYGMGFIDFVDMSGDSATFTLSSCNAGQHHLSLTYALGVSTSHPGPRPMQISVNGVGQPDPIEFPVTGSWTEWGKVFTQVQLLTGTNTVTISAIANSGPNLDFIEVFPLGDEAQGIARVAVDNSYQFYVNNRLVGQGSDWSVTDTWQFNAECSSPTVYAIHANDAEVNTQGVGGLIVDIAHCGESILSSEKWKCTAVNTPHMATPPEQWNEPTFNDQQWESAIALGKNGEGIWNSVKGGPEDGISREADWIWTADNEGHNDIYCRYVSTHQPINCRPAADRYWADYGDVAQANYPAWEHFQQFGRWESRVWHSELCGASCGYQTVALDWVDITATGDKAAKLGDDDLLEMDLPFPFPFFEQLKSHVKISSNGYVTFSGEEWAFGNSFAIPDGRVPNDMVAVFWSDLDPSRAPAGSGEVYTQHRQGSNCLHGVQQQRGGGICCASMCGTCGGSGCGQRPGGVDACCAGHVRDAAVACSETNGVGPCVMDGESFVVEWVNFPVWCGGTMNCYQTDQQLSTFEMILFPSGEIKLQYQNLIPAAVLEQFNPAGKISVGVENAAGNEGVQLGYNDAMHPAPNTAYVFKETCGSSMTTFSIGWCPQFGQQSCDFDYGDQFCKDHYGGQLASPTTQAQYDFIVAIVGGPATHPELYPCPDCRSGQANIGGQSGCGCACAPMSPGAATCLGDSMTAYHNKYLLGFHSDGQGNWETTDNAPFDAAEQQFVMSHGSDGLLGTTQTRMVYFAGANQGQIDENGFPFGGTGGFRDTQINADSSTSPWGIEGFICEFYAAPGQIVIGEDMEWDEARRFCQQKTGGDLLSLHSQEDYDKLAALTLGYTNPVIIGLMSDSAGNWEWADGSAIDMDFLRAHSSDQLAGVGENQGVFFPPTYAGDPNQGLHDWDNRNQRTSMKAFACSSAGEVRGRRGASPTPSPPAGGGH